MRTIASGLMALAILVLAPAGRDARAADKTGEVTIQRVKDHLDFKIGSQLVGRYQIGPEVAKPYLWPLNAPGRVPVTRAWPMEPAKPGGSTDHPHQKSAWFCHGDVIPEGIEPKDKIKGVKGVDFWSEAKGHGRIVCTEVSDLAQREHAAAALTKNEWRMADGTKIMDETRTIQLHDFGKAWLLVFDIDLHASVAPITFGDTKEGSFGVRVNDAITTDKPGKGGKGQGHGKIENAGGKLGEFGCWGQLSPWCDYSGPIDGKTVGITIFNDPKNVSPACWHSRGYGLMAANPFGRSRSFPAMRGRPDLVHLNKGDHLRLRYGLLLHTGDAHAGQVAELYQRFLKLREGGGQ
jgi:Methane oxygenase PmoA